MAKQQAVNTKKNLQNNFCLKDLVILQSEQLTKSICSNRYRVFQTRVIDNIFTVESRNNPASFIF